MFQLSELVLTKVRLNLKSEASKSYLSYAWWVLEPTMFVTVFYIVFGIFLARGTPDFVVFLVCGKIPFLWFSRSITNSANSVLDASGLMGQIAIPKILFPIIVVLQDLIKSCVVMCLMMLFVWFMGLEPNMSWLATLPVMFVQLLFILACALICAAFVPFLPDLKFIINTGVMVMMFASGVFYSFEDVLLAEHQALFLLNPLANLIRMYRQILIEGAWPDWAALGWIVLISSAIVVLMVLWFRKFDGHYPRLVTQ